METENDPLQECFERAISSLNELVIATVRSTTPGRFDDAKKFCEIAQAIVQARAKRLLTTKAEIIAAPQPILQPIPQQQLVQPPPMNRDEAMMADPYQGDNVQYVDVADPPPFRRAVRQGQIQFDDQGRLVNEAGVAFTGPLDANSLMRHMLMAFGPHAQTGAEANRARVAAEEAAELKALLSLGPLPDGSLKHAVLDRRVKQLMANIERRSDAKNPDVAPQVSVVPPDDSRGHPPGEGGAEADAPPRLPAHDIGGAGNGGAPREGVVHAVGANAVV